MGAEGSEDLLKGVSDGVNKLFTQYLLFLTDWMIYIYGPFGLL